MVSFPELFFFFFSSIFAGFSLYIYYYFFTIFSSPPKRHCAHFFSPIISHRHLNVFIFTKHISCLLFILFRSHIFLKHSFVISLLRSLMYYLKPNRGISFHIYVYSTLSFVCFVKLIHRDWHLPDINIRLTTPEYANCVQLIPWSTY